MIRIPADKITHFQVISLATGAADNASFTPLDYTTIVWQQVTTFAAVCSQTIPSIPTWLISHRHPTPSSSYSSSTVIILSPTAPEALRVTPVMPKVQTALSRTSRSPLDILVTRPAAANSVKIIRLDIVLITVLVLII